ncbi:MAG: Rne/Rng family ribonuclease [Pseudomonadaceae bacterium]|nr:Rne/Rng family ribonuclease [Pseudomonadaceae bacterium]
MRRMLIDSTHADETRVAILDGTRLDDFEAETADKAQLKGNIYVGTVSRVEPSLQAAFITYGGNRNGFLAFGELHPQFFNVSKKERAELLDELTDQAERRRGHMRDDDHRDDEGEDAKAAQKAADMADKEDGGSDKRDDRKRQPGIYRRYRVQDVLKEGQKILVQVVKEERGSKGAALTTYVSMPGRYTVLMPNTPYAGGISRKINDPEERRILREMYAAMKVPPHMGLIIRTAGVGQPVDQVVSDYENMRALWDNIMAEYDKDDEVRCVYEDGSLIIRALRDMMREDIDEVLVAGKRGYKMAKDYAKSLMPDAAKLIKEYKDETPLFAAHKVEQKLNQLHFSRVTLPSGGYMIINPTEALVAVDINSGRNTQERNIEETALKTNLEACDELARHIRLRDLAGLIVVDFIDMEDGRNVRKVENAMRKALKRDRARIQYQNISDFGLMEISRQRLRPSFNESHFVTCPHCGGSGLLHAPASAALMVLRRLEEEDCRGADRVIVYASAALVLWILNNKRHVVADLEAKYKYHLVFRNDESLTAPDHRLELVHVKADGSETTKVVDVVLREQPELPPELRQRAPRKRGGRDRDRDNDRRDEPRDDRRNARKDESDEAPSRDERRGRDRDEGDRSSSRERDNRRGSRNERNDRGGSRNERNDRGGSRRPTRVGEEAQVAAKDDATDTKPEAKTDSKPAKGKADSKPVKGKGKDTKPANKAEPKANVKAAAEVAKAEDKPLEVQKVDLKDDDTPVIKPAARKKMEIKKQADTDRDLEPLKVEKVSDAPAKTTRKGLVSRLLG